ncbi:GGDEF domain-containing protein [Agaribacterium haliotis]|uniref:GGDEF domain-containing protein n=1 Tax=Agaribacterium haliotis TaxID=2013869 RepID=UPI0013040358|nr:GGDEF domain-containing protein [Agaribacterium haliotis]
MASSVVADSENLTDEGLVSKARNDFVSVSQLSAIRVVLLYIGVIAAVLYQSVATAQLVLWVFICAVSYLLRLFVFSVYRKEPGSVQALRRWQNLTTTLAALSGLCWSSALFLVFPADSPSHQLLLIFSLVVIAGATVVTLSAYRWAGISFSFTALLPAIAKLSLSDSELHHQLALLLALLFVVLLVAAHYLWTFSDRIISLNGKSQLTIRQLRQENRDLAKLNADLNDHKRALRRDNDSLQKLAASDALTGLNNRRACENEAQIKWQRCRDSGEAMSLMLIDLDFFRQYNEVYGSQAGDKALVAVSSVIAELGAAYTQRFCCSRYSGDQFVVVMPYTDALRSRELAGELRDSIRALRIPATELLQVSPWLSASIGVATATPEGDIRELTALFARAEKALKSAKRDGRNSARHVCELY